MNRSADWLHQAQADLELAGVSAAAGHHEWACFACHQARAAPPAFPAAPMPIPSSSWAAGIGSPKGALMR